jgi:hypothetical protein
MTRGFLGRLGKRASVGPEVLRNTGLHASVIKGLTDDTTNLSFTIDDKTFHLRPRCRRVGGRGGGKGRVTPGSRYLWKTLRERLDNGSTKAYFTGTQLLWSCGRGMQTHITHDTGEAAENWVRPLPQSSNMNFQLNVSNGKAVYVELETNSKIHSAACAADHAK